MGRIDQRSRFSSRFVLSRDSSRIWPQNSILKNSSFELGLPKKLAHTWSEVTQVSGLIRGGENLA